jgi:predicted permease
MEMRVRDYLERGLDAEAADRAASERFGDVERVRRACERLQREERRAVRRREWLGEFRQDVRFGLRMMVRTPLLTAVVVLTLALGIGATTALFSIVNRVLLLPLPYADPARLVRIWEVAPGGDDHNVVSAGNYLDWRARAQSFAELGAHRGSYGVALTGQGEPALLTVVDATPSLLRVLGVSPVIGRAYNDEDARAGRRFVLLSHEVWRTRFGAERAVLGRSIVLDAIPHVILGVMPPEFDFPAPYAEVWRPLAEESLDASERRSHNFLVVARLKRGATLEHAQNEMASIAGALAAEYPESMQGWGVNVAPMHADLVAPVRGLLLVLLGGVVLVLLVTCANIASLLLARAVTREREMVLRGAVGAGRGRLVRQVLTESLVMAAIGGAIGIAAAWLTLDSLLWLAPSDIPLIDEVRLDPMVLAFAAGTTLISTLLFGLLPALRLAGGDLHTTLRESGARAGSAPHARLRSALLVAEVALSLVLLVGAGLLVRSSARLGAVDYGYHAKGLIAATLDLPRTRYDTTTKQREFYARLIERMASHPGVASIAGTSQPPALGYGMTFSFAIEGRPARNPSGREDPEALRVITPGYFRTMGIPVVRGRAFDAADRVGAPEVVIVNESLARKHWPGESPVGRRISMAGAQGPWKEIVGVVGDTRMEGADQAPLPALYIPVAQKTWNWQSWLTLMIRPQAGTDLPVLATTLRSVLRELDPQLPIQRVATVAELYGETVARRRFATRLLAGFAGTALFLGVIGMYGVLAYTVAQKRRDIGIQMALGATSRRVVNDVLRSAMRIALVGIAIGMVASLASARALDSLLYEVSPTDPLTLVLVSLLVMLVALLAAWVPARRATRVSPLAAMRDA